MSLLPAYGNLRGAGKYCREHADEYRVYASMVQPNLDSQNEVWDRVAFAILSANTTFNSAARALAYARTCRRYCDETRIVQLGMTPSKALYLNLIGRPLDLVKGSPEPWHTYRLRLRATVKGLGLAKASFAACLLYPLEADLACIDTWMQKLLLGYPMFKDLKLVDYLAAEDMVRKVARRAGVHTFLAQWMIWDYSRGFKTDHSIFPDQHKGEEAPF